MSNKLTISLGQCSDKGRKEINQDFHGALIPDGQVLALKGITIALTDGISSSSVSQIAAESTIKSLLTDYYCTSDAWSVKTSALSVIKATNSWLFAQTKRSQHSYDMDKGFVCTLSAMIIKSHFAHLFHIGDSRIYRVSGNSLEQLTTDHRTVLSSEEIYLGRAMGMTHNVDVDYQAVKVKVGDIFVLATDGVYEMFDRFSPVQTIKDNDDLNIAAQEIVAKSRANGSCDNLTVQIVRIDALPVGDASEFIGNTDGLPPAPLLEPRAEIDGYKILREIHANNRSHIYLARNLENGVEIALKIPSIDLRENPDYLKRFIMEEWIARRLNSAHVLKAPQQSRPRNYIYVVTEFIDGQTLSQWMVDNPDPELEVVRNIIEQIAKGLRAFHRKEMVHQDLRPENILIDTDGTVKIIDFGSTKVAGITESTPIDTDEAILGTLQYTAPEYFVGDLGSARSDYFSLGVIAYQMLTGKLPYGVQVARIRTKSQQRKLRYYHAHSANQHIPEWVDTVLKKAVHPDPFKRYSTLSEFTADLRKPNANLKIGTQIPLVERNPVAFWKTVSLVLAMTVIALTVLLVS